MVVFTNFSPQKDETNVTRLTVVSFTIIDDGYGININSLSINFSGQQVINAGYFVNNYTGRIFSTTGKYVIGIYPKSPFFAKATKIDIHIEVKDGSDNLNIEDYSFYTIGYAEVQNTIIIPTIHIETQQEKPFFPPADLGLAAAFDSGTGTEVELQWKNAVSSDENNIIIYNVYYSTNYGNVFNKNPDFIVNDIEATIGGLAPGDTHYFGVRVAEFDPVLFTTNGLHQAGLNMFFYPQSILDGYILSTALFIPASTDGFPQFGIIHIGTELIKYSSLDTSGFIIASNGRGYDNTIAEFHSDGSTINLYSGREDGNTTVVSATPTFQKPNYALTWIKSDGYGDDGYRDGYDGYDAYYSGGSTENNLYDGYDGYYLYNVEIKDSITTDGTDNDSSGNFPRFDYCGTWRTMSPQSFMKGQCRSTYFGGVQVRIDKDGERHLVKVNDVKTHMLQREELLLESTGEPFVLLRRMWTGAHCLCYMNRREHPDARCPVCFSTGFVQGYIQFFNPRRSDKRLLIRVDPSSDDLNILDRGGLEPMYEPTAWTLPFPAIKDRDMLIRFNPNNTEEFRYEILDVTRTRVLFTQTGVQKFKMKRLPKTSLIYQFPVIRDTRPISDAIVTSTNSGPGLNPHSHQLIIVNGTDLTKLRTATMESENHNHIIINGVVQSVLGHTHTL